MVFSASSYVAMEKYGNPYYYLKRVSMWAAAGFLWMMAAAVIPYRFYFRPAPFIALCSFALLGLLFTPLATPRNGAVRWLGVGEITVMPGEIAKVSAILFVAWYLSRRPDSIRRFFLGPAPLLAVGGAYFFLIWKQPNLSTAVIVLGLIFVMVFIAGVRWTHLAVLFAGTRH
jgi:cell division protein FtsW